MYVHVHSRACGVIQAWSSDYIRTPCRKLCDAIITYVANIDRAPNKNISLATYSLQVFSAFEVLFSIWLLSPEAKLRIAVVECVGLMTHIIAKDKLEELISKLIPGMLSLYKKHPNDVLSITQGLGAVLAATVKITPESLSPHIDLILATLYPLVQHTPNYEDISTVKAYNEILRAFESVCFAYSDRLISYVFQKLEDTNEMARVGTLSVLKHLINSSSKQLSDKRELVVSGLRPVLGDKSNKVRSTMAQVVIAMAHHDYLSLEGGMVLVQFVVDQCALSVSDETNSAKGKPPKPDDVSTKQLRQMCDNVLHLSTTTISSMQPVLWPYLLEFIVPKQYTEALSTVCKALGTLAEQLREEDDEIFDLDFDVLVNLPRPQEIVARLMVVLGHPLYRDRGIHILHVFEGISPNLHEEIVDL